MATKAKRPTHKRKSAAQKPPAETADQRLTQAAIWAGVTRNQIAFLLKIPPGRIETWWPSIGVSRDMLLAVRLAGALHVDPRWLLLGLPSPAGAAAWKQVQQRCWSMGDETWADLLGFLPATPEPDRGAGVCRYCGCEHHRGCAHGSGGSCWWVDPAATICSACLEPGDE
jgi:hypothetical protein